MSSFKHIRRAVRQPFEIACFRLATWIFPLLPRWAVSSLSAFAGTMTYLLSKRKRIVGLANLDAVFGASKTLREKQTILRKSFCSFAQTMADIFWFSKHTEKRVRQYHAFVPAEGPYFEKRAQILITAHAGNWELIGLESGLLGIDISSIAAVTKNTAVDNLLNQLRQRTGQTIIPREGAMRTLVSKLRNQGTTAFVLDQNTSEADGGIWVNFLGIPTPVSSAPAHLAYRTGTDIIFAFSLPMGGGKYQAVNGRVITPPPFDKTRDTKTVVKELTQQIMDVVSAHIMNHPETWLWSYKHWRRIAPGADPAIYPTYDRQNQTQ